MLKVHVEIDKIQDDGQRFFACCPSCGQKLTDVRYAEGLMVLRVKCRRCKKYVTVDVIGTPPKKVLSGE